MPRMIFQKTVSGFGTTMEQLANRTASGGNTRSITVAKGKAGTLTTRTNNTDGTLTLASGHGIVTAQVIDLYWSGGNRRNVVVGTVSGTSVPISGGAGTNLPVATTAIVASPQSTFSVGIGDTTLLKMSAMALIYGGNPPGMNAILQLTDVSVPISTILYLEGNKGILSDNEGNAEVPIFIGASYQAGVISNPSTVLDATFQMGWVSN